MLTREQKRQQSDQLRETLAAADTVFLLENTGLSVNELNQLRSRVRGIDASYRVFKNSVVKLAVAGTELEVLRPHLVGPKALAFTGGDGVALAKVLKEFMKDHPALSLEQAYMEGELVDAEAARNIADLPSREELVARLLYLLQSPIRRLVVALAAPTRGLAVVINEIGKKKEAEGGSE
jgi:large subunit ribosomal protein L10